MARHARDSYIVRRPNKDFVRIFRNGDIDPVVVPEAAGLKLAPTFAYSHVFDEAVKPPTDDHLVALGTAMLQNNWPSQDSPIPAGYTYLGQFIVHDVTYFQSRNDNLRSPALDLDSVAGLNGERPGADVLFALGCTTFIGAPLPEDLPRHRAGADIGLPLIEDDRNDDFLPLAQIHLLLLKFYNAIARHVGHGCWPAPGDAAVFARLVRRCWVEHFQSVVLHDYLPRLIDPATYEDVMVNKRKLVRLDPDDTAWMPLEFPAALGRFGHGMIRDSYADWNRHQPGAGTNVNSFIGLSYRNSETQLSEFGYALPGNWISNWFRLFDFAAGPYASLASPPIRAGRIDTRIAPQLGSLPTRIRDHDKAEPVPPAFNLAVETLKRNRTLQLQPAQAAIAKINAIPGILQVAELSAAQLVGGESAAVVQAFNDHPMLKTQTPLWYYMLKEADLLGGGQRLGPLASRVVMEVLHAAIEASEFSILDDETWRPTLPSLSGSHFTMPDLIAFSTNPDILGSLSGP